MRFSYEHWPRRYYARVCHTANISNPDRWIEDREKKFAMEFCAANDV